MIMRIGVTGVGLLARDNIPFLRSSNNDLGFGDLLPRHLRIPSELADFDGENFQALGKIADHLLYQGLHRRNVDAFKRVEVKGTGRGVAMLR